MKLPSLSPAIAIFYPKLCIACEEEPYNALVPVCIRCLADLPITNMEAQKENLFTERIYGRIPIESASSLFYFSKGGKVQHLIHQAKYSDDGNIAYLLGIWMGIRLKQSPYFKDIEVIVPVPLHSSKQRSRGFNQSEEFAKGIAEILNTDLYTHTLKRIHSSVSQTTKNRLDRLNNVHHSFELDRVDNLKNKHILLVDDVLTTGATMEACAENLIKIPGVKLSLVTMAIVVD